MNHLERLKRVMNFQSADRLPRIEWASWWDKTVERWRSEGLPELDRYGLYEHFGLDPYFQHWFRPRGDGVPRPTSHGAAIVEDEADYERIRPHLFPMDDWAFDAIRPWAERQDRGQAVVWITVEGFFWFPRTLFGITEHFYAFYDRPALMHRMNRELAEHSIRILTRLRAFCCPAFMTFAEDMSYNHGPMLSQAMFDEFLAPYYRQVVPVLKEMGTTVLVDTDGDCTEMLPWLKAVGVDGVLPLERQAGTDLNHIREGHPDVRVIGHFDKMVMTRGEPAMREEFERLLPVMRAGGFIPSVDHQTPPGVSLDQYRCYLRLLAEYTAAACR